MGQVWEGTSPRWAGAPPTKAQAHGRMGGGKPKVQMGLKAHPSGAPPLLPLAAPLDGI